MIRSVLAVIDGLVALTACSFALEFATNPLLLKLFPESLPDEAAISSNPLAGAFVIEYSLVCVAFGGYVTAWIAGRAPVKHALVTRRRAVTLHRFRDDLVLRASAAAKFGRCTTAHGQRGMGRPRATLESSYETSQ